LELQAARTELQETIDRRARQADRLKERLQAIRRTRQEAEGRSLTEATRLLAEVRRLQSELQTRPPASETEMPAAQISELEDQIRSARARSRRSVFRVRQLARESASPGRFAWSHDLQTVVRIDSEPDAADRVWIVHGTIRFLVPIQSLGLPPAELQDAPQRRRRDAVRGPEVNEDVVERQIDVRGRTAQEGLEEIERYVDRAALAGIPEVRIIHGKGKGILKREIEGFLTACPLVESFRTAEPREGGWGATIVRLRSAQVGA